VNDVYDVDDKMNNDWDNGISRSIGSRQRMSPVIPTSMVKAFYTPTLATN